jgi:1-acyl-sn-glycerol-3-phosphate acyltransferase
MSTLKVPKKNPIAGPLARGFLHLVSDFKVYGELPEPPYITVANHMSYWDSIPSTAIIKDPPGILTAKKYQGKLLGNMVQFFLSPIWIEQASPDRAALREALAILEAGYSVALSPEGTRSRSGALSEPLDGAAFLIHKAKVQVIPVGFSGTDHLFKSLRPRVEVHIGRPFHLPDVKRPGKEQLKEHTDRLMCAIAALLPERYHGIYAGHPLVEEMRAIVR